MNSNYQGNNSCMVLSKGNGWRQILFLKIVKVLVGNNLQNLCRLQLPHACRE